ISAASPKPLSTMSAPCCASALAIPRPMPLVEPVTTATFPLSMTILLWSTRDDLKCSRPPPAMMARIRDRARSARAGPLVIGRRGLLRRIDEPDRRDRHVADAAVAARQALQQPDDDGHRAHGNRHHDGQQVALLQRHQMVVPGLVENHEAEFAA